MESHKNTLYGVRASGNLAECGLRRTAEVSKNEFPKACTTLTLMIVCPGQIVMSKLCS